MPTAMKVRGLGSNNHDANEFVVIPMYIPGKDGKIALITRELHIVDDLSAKVLIGIDIMKPEGIMIDTGKDLATITSCGNLQIPVSMITKGARTDTTVVSKFRHTVPAHSDMAITVKSMKSDLPQDRDLLFEPSQLDALIVTAYVVDCDMDRIMVRNDTDLPVIIGRHARLGKVIEYEAAGCFQVDTSCANLAMRPPKTSASKLSVKSCFKAGLAIVAAFNAVTAPRTSSSTVSNITHPSLATSDSTFTLPNSFTSQEASAAPKQTLLKPSVAPNVLSQPETLHPTGTTIYGDDASASTITDVVDSFPDLWKDTGNVANIPESEWMEIPLIDNWKELYKAGQARVYPLGKRDKDVIDGAFDELYQQGRMEWITTATPFSFPCFVV